MTTKATANARTEGDAGRGLSMSIPALELIGLEKHFGPVHANRGVTMHFYAGSVVGIIGENGAGKSTCMNLVYGLYRPDAGEIRVNGETVRHSSPADAISHHIGMVHQHFMLVEKFTVLENVILGAEDGAMLSGSLSRARRQLQKLSDEYGLKVDVDARICDLPVGEQQRVEILKALYRGARILILDEPTAVLTPQEAEQLFRILKALTDKGATIILITHKLKEILAATDHVYVMRAGEVVAERTTAQTCREELAELMVGRKMRLAVERGPAQAGAPALRVENVSIAGAGDVPLLADIGFTLRAGEIVGIAGVAGNGQTELLEVLAGMRQPTSGEVYLGDRLIDAVHPITPADARALGMAYVPEDRLRFALAGRFSAADTAVLGYQRKAPFTSARGLLDPAAISGHCADAMARYDVRPPRPELEAGHFSGGNQQKLVIARETAATPRVLLAGQPTRGVDIGAIAFIHKELVRLRDEGAAILLVSCELEEILALSDRILVMCGGRISGEVAADQADEKTLGLMMANVWKAA